MAVWMTGEPAAALPSGAVLILSVWRLWLPATWEIAPLGITVRYLARSRIIPWSRLGRREVFSQGIFFETIRSDGSASRLHGIFMPWGRHSAAVSASLAAMGPEPRG